jgi:hypothetical protein
MAGLLSAWSHFRHHLLTVEGYPLTVAASANEKQWRAGEPALQDAPYRFDWQALKKTLGLAHFFLEKSAKLW